MKMKLFALSSLVFGLLFSSCWNRSGGTEVTIGAVLPLTGPVASYGTHAKAGVDLALDEINSQGSQKIRVIYEDDAGQVQNAVSATQKLISTDKVPLIVGEAASGLSLAIAPICNSNKVVLFSPISSAAELTEKGGDYFFRDCPSDAFQARILAKWLLEEKIARVSILFINNSWGTSLKDEFVSHFTSDGGSILTSETCNEGDRDFRTQLTKMAKPEAQAFVVFTYGKEGGPFLRQARELSIKQPMYGGDVWGSPELLEAAGKAAEGVYFTFPATPTGGKYEAFASKYHSRYGSDPDVYAAYSYDLTQIVAIALASGARSGEQIRQYLMNMTPVEGVTGMTQFDKNGDVITKTFDRKVIKDGKYVVVKP